ncbi:MAG: SDR family oxidoreductase [Chloroflexota bacterium]
MEQILTGKNVLITGATNGIGLVTARELAALGARVTIIGRNKEKCQSTISDIKLISPKYQVDYICADLSDNEGVEAAAGEFLKRNSNLDILINNAGGVFMKRVLNKDGIEMTFSLNHLGYFHLTYLLMESLLANDGARIINVSSDAHRGGQIKFDDIQFEAGYSGFGAYSQSKLANLHFTYFLADKYKGTNLTCNALHPGFVDTGFGKNNGKLMTLGLSLMRPFQKTVEDGASTSVYLAASPDVEGISGKYFVQSKAEKSSPQSYDFNASKKLWDLSLVMCGIEKW